MKVPLGPFGYRTPGATPAADTRAIGAGLAQLGAGVAELGGAIAQERQAVARARGLNATLDDRIEVAKRVTDVRGQIERGELQYDRAGAVLQEQLGEIRQPDVSGLDPVTAENVRHAVKVQREGAMLDLGEIVTKARTADAARQLTNGFDKLAVMSTFEQTDPQTVLRQAGTLSEFARSSGVSTEEVDGRMSALRTQVARSMAVRDPRAALTKLATAQSGDPVFDGLSYEGRLQVTQHAQTQLVSQSSQDILSIFAEEGPGAGSRALAALDQSGLPADLRDDVRAQVNSKVSALRVERREQFAPAIANLEQQIALGTAGREAHELVENLWTNSALSPAEYANYGAAIDRAGVERAKDGAAAREIAAVLAQGLPLDPRNKDHRDALDAAFRQDTLEAPLGSPAWQATAAAYANKTRMLPDQAIAWTRQAMRSPTANIAAAAAQFYGAVQTSAPDAVGELDTDTKASAGLINSMIEAGTQPAKAVETARAIMEVNPQVRERRTAQYRLEAKGSDAALADLVDRDFDPGLFASPPALSAGLAATFEEQSGRYFAKVGDIGLARDLAWSDLKRVYGPSRVNGEATMTMFPPERFGVTPDEIRTELGNFLKGNPQADGSGAADITLVPDGLTQRQVFDALDGRPVQPSYKLVTKTRDLALTRSGEVMRYTVPNGEELAQRFKATQDAAAAEAQALVDQAKRDRAEARAVREAYESAQTAPGVHR